MNKGSLFTGVLEMDIEIAKRLIASYPHVDLATLITIATDRTQPESARIAAVYTLGFTDDDGLSLQALKDIVEADETEALRDHAAEALANINPCSRT